MRRPLALMVLILLTVGATSCGLLLGPQSSYQVPTPSPSYVIVSNSLPFHEVWRQVVGSSIEGTSGRSAPIMTVAAGIIVLPTSNEHATMLMALGARDGKRLWTRELVDPSFPDMPEGVMSILADSKRVYVTLLSFYAKAFDLADGKPLWTTKELRGHTGYDIFPLLQGDTIQLYSTPNNTAIYNINITDGQIKSVDEYPRDLIMKTPTMRCFNSTKSMSCVNANTNQALWPNPAPDSAQMWPVFVNPETMIYTSVSYEKAIVAVDIASGRVLWQTTRNVTSNIAVVNGIVYSLRTDAALVAQDALTGHQIGLLQFNNGPLQKQYGTEYWVVAGDSMLFVYFGDSQELIALGP